MDDEIEKRARKIGAHVEFRGKVSDNELKDGLRKARVLDKIEILYNR